MGQAWAALRKRAPIYPNSQTPIYSTLLPPMSWKISHAFHFHPPIFAHIHQTSPSWRVLWKKRTDQNILSPFNTTLENHHVLKTAHHRPMSHGFEFSRCRFACATWSSSSSSCLLWRFAWKSLPGRPGTPTWVAIGYSSRPKLKTNKLPVDLMLRSVFFFGKKIWGLHVPKVTPTAMRA